MKVNKTSSLELGGGGSKGSAGMKSWHYTSTILLELPFLAFAINRDLLQLNLPFFVVEPVLQLTTWHTHDSSPRSIVVRRHACCARPAVVNISDSLPSCSVDGASYRYPARLRRLIH